MDMTELFKAFIDNDTSPVVMCTLDYHIAYINPAAVKKYSRPGKNVSAGAPLLPLMSEESRTKLDMTVEWFREDKNNNKVFALHYDEENTDIYICAVRDQEGEVVGFYSLHESRDPETEEPYNVD